MGWLAAALVFVVMALALAPWARRRREREWEDLTGPGMPARRVRQGRGVGHLGEAPAWPHHRMGGDHSD